MASRTNGSTFKAMVRAKSGPAYVSWHTLGDPVAIETAAAAGWDGALIDQQHGAGGNDVMVGGLIAARSGGVPAVVRVGWNDKQLISRALDAGAHGVVCPMINTGDEARAFVKAAKYPPLGERSWGPYRAGMVFDGDYLAIANDETLTIAQIETRSAVDHLEAIVTTEGLDAALVGPNDLAISLTGERNVEAPQVLEAMAKVRKLCSEHGRLSWIFANDPKYAAARAEEGWDIITVGTDGRWIAFGAEHYLPD